MTNNTAIVLGMPASGKSTLISLLKKKMEKEGKRVKVINDFVVLKEICPKNKASSDYHYEGDYLVLETGSRSQVLERLFEEMADRLKNVSGDYEFCFIEFTSPSWSSTLERYFGNTVASGAIIIYIDLDKRTVNERNQARSEDERVPQEYLDMFTESNLKELLCSYEVKMIDNNGTLTDFRVRINALWPLVG